MSNWYFETTNEDTVISTRIRIARNIKNNKFGNRASKEEKEQILSKKQGF